MGNRRIDYRKSVTENPLRSNGTGKKVAILGSTTFSSFGADAPVAPDDASEEYFYAQPSEREWAYARVEHGTYFPGSQQWHEDDDKSGRLQPVLFTQDTPKLVSLASSRKMTHTVPTLLGLSYNQTGGHMTYDESLSEYSSPIVKKALARGWVSTNPDNETGEITNEETFDDDGMYSHPYRHGNEVSTAEVSQAKATVRNLLRNKAPAREPRVTAHLSEQFTQKAPDTKLPGMEDW